MSLLNENIDIKIKEIQRISWDKLSVQVAARPYHALAFRLCGSASFSHKDEQLSTTTGNVLYMPANYDYHATYTDRNEMLVIHFESALVSPMENYELNNPRIISSLFHKAYDTCKTADPRRKASLHGEVFGKPGGRNVGFFGC